MRLIEMSPPQVVEYFKHNDTVLFGTGSIENHGVHNCLGIDTLVPDHILGLIEKKSDVMIVPTLPYGAVDAMLGCPGTISLGQEVLYSVIDKIVESLYLYGARRIVFVNGHGGNINTLEQIGLKWRNKGLISANISWWTLLPELRPDKPEWVSGHGGAVETSLAMAINPKYADLSKIQEMNIKNDHGDELPSRGYRSVVYKGVTIAVNRQIPLVTDNGWFESPIGADHPSTSNAEMGNDIMQAVADYIVDFTEAFKRAKID